MVEVLLIVFILLFLSIIYLVILLCEMAKKTDERVEDVSGKEEGRLFFLRAVSDERLSLSSCLSRKELPAFYSVNSVCLRQ
jgi:hypothetical protein